MGISEWAYLLQFFTHMGTLRPSVGQLWQSNDTISFASKM